MLTTNTKAIIITIVVVMIIHCRAEDPCYTVVSLRGGGVGYKINNHGTVVGKYNPHRYDSSNTNDTWYMYLYSDLDGLQEFTWPTGYQWNVKDINDQGMIVVDTYTNTTSTAYLYTLTNGFNTIGAINNYIIPSCINEAGRITGAILDDQGRTRVFVYDIAAGVQILDYGRGNAINKQGWIAGVKRSAGDEGENRAVVWKGPENVLDIGPGDAYDISNNGIVVGEYYIGDPYYVLAGFVYRDGNIHLQGHPDGGYDVAFNAVNEHEEVIGVAGKIMASDIPLYWSRRHGLVDLNKLISTNSGWRLLSANDINDLGQITGQGVYNGKLMAYRLDPIRTKMEIGLAGSNTVVRWYPDWPGMVLEAADNPTSTNWQAIATGETNIITLPRRTTEQFFRLSRPNP